MQREGFENFGATMARIRQNVERADAAAQPWQQALQPGDFCVVVAGGGVHYIQILDWPNDYRRPEKMSGTNFRWARGFSQAERTGNLETMHVAVVTGGITRKQFECALELHWPGTSDGFAEVVAGDPRWERTA